MRRGHEQFTRGKFNHWRFGIYSHHQDVKFESLWSSNGGSKFTSKEFLVPWPNTILQEKKPLQCLPVSQAPSFFFCMRPPKTEPPRIFPRFYEFRPHIRPVRYVYSLHQRSRSQTHFLPRLHRLLIEIIKKSKLP